MYAVHKCVGNLGTVTFIERLLRASLCISLRASLPLTVHLCTYFVDNLEFILQIILRGMGGSISVKTQFFEHSVNQDTDL